MAPNQTTFLRHSSWQRRSTCKEALALFPPALTIRHYQNQCEQVTYSLQIWPHDLAPTGKKRSRTKYVPILTTADLNEPYIAIG